MSSSNIQMFSKSVFISFLPLEHPYQECDLYILQMVKWPVVYARRSLRSLSFFFNPLTSFLSIALVFFQSRFLFTEIYIVISEIQLQVYPVKFGKCIISFVLNALVLSAFPTSYLRTIYSNKLSLTLCFDLDVPHLLCNKTTYVSLLVFKILYCQLPNHLHPLGCRSQPLRFSSLYFFSVTQGLARDQHSIFTDSINKVAFIFLCQYLKFITHCALEYRHLRS